MKNTTRSLIADEVRYAIHLDKSIKYFQAQSDRADLDMPHETVTAITKSAALCRKELLRTLELIDTLMLRAVDRGENVGGYHAAFDDDLERLEAEYRPVRPAR